MDAKEKFMIDITADSRDVHVRAFEPFEGQTYRIYQGSRPCTAYYVLG